MRIVTAEALLLDVLDLHDRDRIVTFLTAREGKKRGVARGARRKYSRFSGQLQPLAKVRISWFEKEGRDLVRITDVALLRPAAPLQADLEGILLGGYLADHLLEFAQENEPSELLFRLLDSTLEALLAGVDRELAARYFEAWVLRLGGIYPAPAECPLCLRPLAADEGAALVAGGDALTCRSCAGEGARTVSPAAAAFLRRIGRRSLRAMAGEPPAPGVLAEAEQVAASVRRSFLGHELRSYEMIRRTLRDLGPPGAAGGGAQAGGRGGADEG